MSGEAPSEPLSVFRCVNVHVYAAGGYSVLGWNHPGFGGSTVSAGVRVTTFDH